MLQASSIFGTVDMLRVRFFFVFVRLRYAALCAYADVVVVILSLSMRNLSC